MLVPPSAHLWALTGRERWLNHLDPIVKKGRLSDHEWDLVLAAHKAYGNRCAVDCALSNLCLRSLQPPSLSLNLSNRHCLLCRGSSTWRSRGLSGSSKT